MERRVKINKKKKSYYAIIPANVRYCKKLNPNAKLLYGEITALANEKGFCWANNKYFADLYEVDKISISRWIGKLEENGFIKCELINNNRRKIYMTIAYTKLYRGIYKNVEGDIQKCIGHNNNTKNNKTNSVVDEPHDNESFISTPFFKDKKTFDESRSNELEKALRLKRKLCKRVNKKQWIRYFIDLRIKFGIEEKRIKKVLNWYISHFDEEFVPIAYSASGFCNKFLRIERAMEKRGGSESEERVIVYKKTKNKNIFKKKSVLRSDWEEYKAKGWIKKEFKY